MAFTTPKRTSARQVISEGWATPQLVDNTLALYDLHVHEVGNGKTANVWNISSGAGTYESDPDIAVTVTLEVKSTVIVIADVLWYAAAVKDDSISFSIRNITDSTPGVITNYLGTNNIGNCKSSRVIGYFTDVAAGAKTFRLRAARNDAVNNRTVRDRKVSVWTVGTP